MLFPDIGKITTLTQPALSYLKIWEKSAMAYLAFPIDACDPCYLSFGSLDDRSCKSQFRWFLPSFACCYLFSKWNIYFLYFNFFSILFFSVSFIFYFLLSSFCLFPYLFSIFLLACLLFSFSDLLCLSSTFAFSCCLIFVCLLLSFFACVSLFLIVGVFCY